MRNVSYSKEQLSQFSTIANSNDVSNRNLIKIISNFGKSHVQIYLMSEVLKLEKLLLVMSATEATRERLFSAMKHIHKI